MTEKKKRAIEKIRQLINDNWTKDNVTQVTFLKNQNMNKVC